MILQRVVPLLLALSTGAAPVSDVSEVEIAPAGGETEITIRTSGDVEVRDFRLDDPVRLIVDLEGARHALPRYSYEGIGRGGVVRMRTSQFRDDVVRLVFDLSRPLDYTLTHSPGVVRVRFRNPGRSFRRWTTAATGEPPAAAPADDRMAAARSGSRADGASLRQASAGALDRASRTEFRSSGSAPQQASQQPRISVTYEQADLLDVLAGFSEFAGISIVPSPAVSGTTVRGVEIRDKPWDVALDAILSSQGYGWRRMESGIILVDELSAIRARDTLQTETRVMRVNYADAVEVANALGNLSTERGQVVAYQGTNSVIVTDAPSVVTRMDSLVSVLDKRTPQVAIETKIVFVDRTSLNELGIGYDIQDADQGSSAISNKILGDEQGSQEQEDGDGGGGGGGGGTTGPVVGVEGGAINALANAGARVPGAALSILASTTIGDFSIFSFLDATSQVNLTDVQAAPTIQVLDNESAMIQVGEDVPIRVLEAGAQTQQAQATVRFEPTGIIMNVTPHVTNNNQVVLDVRAERSGVQLGQQDVGFTVNKQIGETRVLVNDGETAVIGGLTRSEVTESESGIPGLMHVPILGNLFKQTRRQEFKEDLIILVTPHVISAPGGMGEAGMGSVGMRR